MEKLNELLNNQWVITVGGGLLLTLLTRFLGRFWNFRKSQKDINNCRLEVLSILEKVITDGTELTIDLLQSIVGSVVRKNDIPATRFFSNSELIEDILVSLYLNNYIGINEKKEIIIRLLDLKKIVIMSENKSLQEIPYKESTVDTNNNIFGKFERIRIFLMMYFVILFMIIFVFYIKSIRISLFDISYYLISILAVVVSSTTVFLIFRDGEIKSKRREKTQVDLLLKDIKNK